MSHTRSFAVVLLAIVLTAHGSIAQVPAKDPSARLREVLPADVAQRVLARIAAARARQLPAEALENRALKFAAKGVDPSNIERSVNEQAARMEIARAALVNGRPSDPAGDRWTTVHKRRSGNLHSCGLLIYRALDVARVDTLRGKFQRAILECFGGKLSRPRSRDSRKDALSNIRRQHLSKACRRIFRRNLGNRAVRG